MGCVSSKNAQDDPKKIDYTFEWTWVSSIDQFFQNARDVLQGIETIRYGIEDCREKLIEETLVYQLKNPDFREAINVLFWCISAANGGNIAECNPRTTYSAPYFTIDQTKIRYETSKQWDYFRTYLGTICDGPSKIATLLTNFMTLLTEAPGLIDRAGPEAVNSGQNPMQKAQTILKTTNNVKKLQKQVDKVKRVPDIVEEAKKELEGGLLNFLEEVIKNCDEVGRKAAAEKKLLAKDIFPAYHPGPKKSPEEIAAMSKKK